MRYNHLDPIHTHMYQSYLRSLRIKTGVYKRYFFSRYYYRNTAFSASQQWRRGSLSSRYRKSRVFERKIAELFGKNRIRFQSSKRENLHRVALSEIEHGTELHRKKRGTELHQKKRGTELHRKKRGTELHRKQLAQSCITKTRGTELHRKKNVAQSCIKANIQTERV